MSNEIIRLTIQNGSLFKSKSSGSNALTKAVHNINSVWGPAMYYNYKISICMPFVMQRAGLIPSILAYILICVLSMFSLMCVNETYNILSYSKNVDFTKRFDLINLIKTLFKTELLSTLSVNLIYINHFVFTYLIRFSQL